MLRHLLAERRESRIRTAPPVLGCPRVQENYGTSSISRFLRRALATFLHRFGLSLNEQDCCEPGFHPCAWLQDVCRCLAERENCKSHSPRWPGHAWAEGLD